MTTTDRNREVSTATLASSAADSDALEVIERHHAELVGGLAGRTAALLSAVRGTGDWRRQRDALVTWSRVELLPHAEAEEAVLYPAAREFAQFGALIRAMSQEHALLADLVARLGSADDPAVALFHAGAAQTLFEAHVAKENDLLLPAMVAAQGTSVAQLLAEMRTVLREREADAVVPAATSSGHDELAETSPGHSCGCHDEVGSIPELDARTIPHAIRHATIFGALDAVAPAADLILVAPHDPLPLLAQIEQRWPSVFTVAYLERGPEVWRLQFTRTAAGPIAGSIAG